MVRHLCSCMLHTIIDCSKILFKCRLVGRAVVPVSSGMSRRLTKPGTCSADWIGSSIWAGFAGVIFLATVPTPSIISAVFERVSNHMALSADGKPNKVSNATHRPIDKDFLLFDEYFAHSSRHLIYSMAGISCTSASQVTKLAACQCSLDVLNIWNTR